jgi:hypothetical protein
MKGIVIKKVSETKTRVKFQIVEQSFRGSKFGDHGSRTFRAKNGVILASSGSPQVGPYDNKMIYVRGDRKNFDNTILSVGQKRYQMILKAAEEYNKKNGYVNHHVLHDIPDDLFRIE